MRELFANCIFDRDKIPNIQECEKFNSQKKKKKKETVTIWLKNWAEDLHRHFFQEHI